MINFYYGFTFLFSSSYGWDVFFGTVVADFFIFLPINIVSIALVVSAFANKKVRKIVSSEGSIDEQQN